MLSLIDTHQHLIFPDRLDYAWAETAPALAGREFGPGEYHAVTEGAGVAGSIFMEADVSGNWRTETRHVATLAADPANGILGIIASCRPEDDTGFEAWLDEGRDLGVVGYRRILHEVDDEVSRGATFRANVRRLGARGFVFDMVYLARQLSIALELVRSCPEVRFVLDHCGVPDIAGGGFDPWRADVAALAREPNVVAKISGVFAYCAPGAVTLAAVRPYVDHVIETFGAERCVWGSDWPVVNVRGGSLPEWLAATREILARLSADEAAAIAHGTAEQVYGVRLPG